MDGLKIIVGISLVINIVFLVMILNQDRKINFLLGKIVDISKNINYIV